jgi:Predicted Zn peptidase
MESLLAIAAHAKNFRDNVGLSESDIVPDIVDLIKTQKYEYKEEFSNEGYAGFSEYIGDWIYRIGFNTCHDYGIQFRRFTLAHELGHVYMPSHQAILRDHPLHRSYYDNKYDKNTEIEADNFAANFLAPSNFCLRFIQNKECSPETMRQIADYFIISTHAAALRFIELTDLVCTIVIFNETGTTEFERRSPKMEEMLKPFFIPYVRKTKIHEHTLAYEVVKGKSKKETCESLMNLWYPKLPKEVSSTESILDLGYRGKYMALLTPTIPYLDEYLAEEEKSPTIY